MVGPLATLHRAVLCYGVLLREYRFRVVFRWQSFLGTHSRVHFADTYILLLLRTLHLSTCPDMTLFPLGMCHSLTADCRHRNQCRSIHRDKQSFLLRVACRGGSPLYTAVDPSIAWFRFPVAGLLQRGRGRHLPIGTQAFLHGRETVRISRAHYTLAKSRRRRAWYPHSHVEAKKWKSQVQCNDRFAAGRLVGL